MRGISRQGWHEVGLLRSHLLPLRPQWFAARLRVPAPVLAPVVALAARRTVGTRTATSARRWPTSATSPTPSGRCSTARRTRAWSATPPGCGGDRDRPGDGAYRYVVARRDGELRGLAVATEREQRGGRFTYLLELLVSDERAARAVVSRVAAGAEGSAGVLVATMPGTPLARRARAAGLRQLPQRLEEKQLHFGVVGGDPALRSGWSLGWGDLDHL